VYTVIPVMTPRFHMKLKLKKIYVDKLSWTKRSNEEKFLPLIMSLALNF